MNAKGRRLANVLSRLLAVLTGISGLGLVALVPTTLFAFARPDLLAASSAAHANGVPSDLARSGMVGTVMALGIGFLIVALVVVVNLRRIMKTVAGGMPFAIANVGRLRTIAGAMAALLIGQVMTGLVLPARLRELGDVHDGFNAGLFLGLLVVLVLAEVFREGARLHDDVEGTI